ncbi:hypothetical protein SASK131_13900 [Staphylococcus argenteus]|nr:hypothetical protein TMSFP064_13310 [Staphylococcus argenteus]BCN90960.1 hypothetical protein TMSFP069_13350 [Staphylococcus argenteus]GJF39459.1 hypothetical protein SA19056_16660 [Staphylococcus argenteus]GJF40720.1 hypothetical protein SA19059_03720 [Staphylococcus argenteus]GJF45743.1 hypothetical protein SA19080_02590 [Staphylococcus argenteus]
MSTPHDIITIHINIICKKLKSFEALRLLIIFKFQFKLTVIYVAFVILIITLTSFTIFIILNNAKNIVDLVTFLVYSTLTINLFIHMYILWLLFLSQLLWHLISLMIK